MAGNCPSLTVSIRLAVPADRAAIDTFAIETVHDVYDSMIGRDHAIELLQTWWGVALDEAIRAGDVHLALDAERVVGLAELGWWEGDPVLWKLYVAPGGLFVLRRS